MTMMPTMAASATECQKTKRKMEPSLPTWLVAAVAMQMDCASIILPITPPALFVAHMRMGLRLSCWAVIFCKPPKRTFEDVSLPVRADRKSTRLNSSHGYISYAVFCLKKKTNTAYQLLHTYT